MMAKWNFSKIDDGYYEEKDFGFDGDLEFDRTEAHTLRLAGGLQQDNVNSPSHYGQGKIEAIEYISDFLTPEEYQGYLRGNIAKYLHRFPYKNGLEDLKKASWYLDRLIKEVEK